MPDFPNVINQITTQEAFLGSKVQVAPFPIANQANGTIVNLVAGELLSFGQVCYFRASDSRMWRANATAVATAPVMAMAIGPIAAGATGRFLLLGVATLAAWTWTVGGVVYLSTTAGGMTQTPPSATDQVLQVLGVALSPTTVLFNPSLNYFTRT